MIWLEATSRGESDTTGPGVGISRLIYLSGVRKLSAEMPSITFNCAPRRERQHQENAAKKKK